MSLRFAARSLLLLLVAMTSFGQTVAPPGPVIEAQDCQLVRAALTAVMDEARTAGVERWGFRWCYFLVSDVTPPVLTANVPTIGYFMSEAQKTRFEQLRGTSAYVRLLERGAAAHEWCNCELPTGFSFTPESVLPADILEPDPRFRWGGPEFFVDGIFRVAFPGVSDDGRSAIVYMRGSHYIWQTWKAYDLEKIDGQWMVREVFTLYTEGE